MAVVEIGARIGTCLFLVWSLFAFHRDRSTGTRTSATLGLIACGLGILGDLKGLDQASFVAAVILGSAAAVMSMTFRFAPGGAAQQTALRPLVATAVGFFAGQGILLLAVILTLGVILLEATAAGRPGLLGAAASGSRTLHIRAQSIRGVIGRVEAALERLGLKPSSMAVQHNTREKELTIVTELALPAETDVKTLIAALQEIEGVIEFGLE